MYLDIAESGDWVSVEPIEKGWSSDKKLRVTTGSGRRLLLRLSSIEEYEAKKREYEIISKYSRLPVDMSKPAGFGACDGGRQVYILLTWVEGRDLEDVLPTLPEHEQYRLGREAGRILERIHAIPVEGRDLPSRDKREKKLAQLSAYEASRVRIPGDRDIAAYVRKHIDRIQRMPPAYLHGDFHPGNLIYREDGGIGVIDFNRWEVGDPCEEFYKLQSFGRELSVPYCVGQIDGYFHDAVPEDFWSALAVYVAHASLYSVKWAEKFGQRDVDAMVRRYRLALDDYDRFAVRIPKWYAESRGLYRA